MKLLSAQFQDSLAAIARDHEALRMCAVRVVCPQMHPTDLDDNTRKLVAVVSALLNTKKLLEEVA